MKSRLFVLMILASGSYACGSELAGPEASTTSIDAPGLLLTANAAPAEKRALPPFPFWARGPGCCLDGWGAVTFYVADPQQVPDDFNFISFFDPRALSADWAVSGFGLFKDPASPEMTNLHGLGAVPMWFFRPGDIAAMAADGVITRPEMETYNPVRGHATTFRELFVPVTANSTQARHVLVARGTLEDGGSFRSNWIQRLNENTGQLSLVGNITVTPN